MYYPDDLVPPNTIEESYSELYDETHCLDLDFKDLDGEAFIEYAINSKEIKEAYQKPFNDYMSNGQKQKQTEVENFFTNMFASPKK